MRIRLILAAVFICLAGAAPKFVCAAPSPPAIPSPPAREEMPTPVSHWLCPTSMLVLSEEQALRLALAHNATLKVAERQEKEAYWAWKLAGKAPSLTVGLNYQGGSSTNNYGSVSQDVNLNFTQTFAPFGNTAAAGRAAFKAYELAKVNVMQTRLTLTQNVRDGFSALLIAQEQKSVAEENLELANALYDLTVAKFKGGAAPKLDVMNAEIQRATSVQALIQARGTLEQARAALIPLLQLSATDVVLARASPELPNVAAALDELVATANHSHPQVLAAIKALEQSVAAVRVARTQANPSTSLFVIYDPSNVFLPNILHSPIYAMGGTISVPLDWGILLFGVRQARETVAEKEAALSGARSAVVGGVKGAFAAYRAAFTNAATYRDAVLRPSENVLRVTELGYRRGALPYAQLLTAQSNLRAARAQYFSLLLAGHQALHALEAAVGQALDNPPLPRQGD